LDIVLNIAEITLFISASVLCVYLIKAIGKIAATISNIETSVKELQNKLEPILDNLTILTEKSKKITESVSEQIDISRSAVKTFKTIAEDVLDFERNIKDTIERPVNDFLSILMGILSGVKMVSGLFKKDKE
jgi:uncharacterized protein YoxC